MGGVFRSVEGFFVSLELLPQGEGSFFIGAGIPEPFCPGAGDRLGKRALLRAAWARGLRLPESCAPADSIFLLAAWIWSGAMAVLRARSALAPAGPESLPARNAPPAWEAAPEGRAALLFGRDIRPQEGTTVSPRLPRLLLTPRIRAMRQLVLGSFVHRPAQGRAAFSSSFFQKSAQKASASLSPQRP